MIRIDVSGDDDYTIPPDSPFADGNGGAPEAWVTGLRNPWRMAFDRVTGDLYIADVGQAEVEEVSVLGPNDGGANLGWNRFEG